MTAEEIRMVSEGCPNDQDVPVRTHTDEELSQLAKDIHAGRVFTSLYCSRPELLRSIFMPIAFGSGPGIFDDCGGNPGMLYEYLDRAGPMAINGYPMFFSVQWLTQEEVRMVMAKVEQINKLLAQL